MIMRYKGFTVSVIDDCDENKGGYFCQVYASPDFSGTLDFFCIHPDELSGCDNPKLVARRMRKLIRVYIRNNFKDLKELKLKTGIRRSAENQQRQRIQNLNRGTVRQRQLR